MRFSDYKRLGKISIKSRKKSTKNTVRGISFGLILIVSVVFLSLSVFMSFNTEVNKIRTLAAFSLESKNIYDTSASEAGTVSESGYIQNRAVPSYAAIQRIKDSDACEESLTSSYLTLSQGAISFSLDGADEEELIIEAEYGSGSVLPNGNISTDATVKICNLEASDGKIFLDAELEDLNGASPFVAGGNFTGQTGGKKEVILTLSAAKSIAGNASIESIIGKKLSLITYATPEYSSYLEYDNNPDNVFTPDTNSRYIPIANTFMKDFVIKGVVNDELLGLASRAQSGEDEGQIWISDNSLYYTDELGEATSLLPHARVMAVENNDYTEYNYIYTYKSDLASMTKKAEDEGVILPIFAGVRLNRGYSYSYYGEEPKPPSLKAVNILQGANFKDAVDLAAVIDSELAPLYVGAESSAISNTYQSMLYTLFKMLFTALQVVVLVLFIFGGVIFVTSMLNLYNSINYSVQARRNYLGMMRAIGAKDGSIPKMYFVEMVLIFTKTLIPVLIFSFGICYGLKALIALLIKQAGNMLMGMNLSLNIMFYPISLVLVYSIMFLIAVLFALGACTQVAKKPILDVLRTDI